MDDRRGQRGYGSRELENTHETMPAPQITKMGIQKAEYAIPKPAAPQFHTVKADGEEVCVLPQVAQHFCSLED